MTRRLFLALLALGALAGPAPARAARRPKPTILVIKTNPGRAHVTVNGDDKGLSKVTLRDIAPGEYTISAGKTGYEVASKTATVTANKTTTVLLRLKKTPKVSREDKKERRAAVLTEFDRTSAWKQLNFLFFNTPGLSAPMRRAPLNRDPIGPFPDPATGLYVIISDPVVTETETTVTANYYQDAAATVPAGQLSVITTATSVSITFNFTAGTYAGASGSLSVTPVDETAYLITGSTTLPDGTVAAEDLTVSIDLAGGAFSSDGTVNVTYPDGSTAAWTIHITAAGTDISATDGVFTMQLHINTDGSGSGALTLNATGATLATVVWDAAGSGTITYPDGTTEHIDLF